MRSNMTSRKSSKKTAQQKVILPGDLDELTYRRLLNDNSAGLAADIDGIFASVQGDVHLDSFLKMNGI